MRQILLLFSIYLLFSNLCIAQIHTTDNFAKSKTKKCGSHIYEENLRNKNIGAVNTFEESLQKLILQRAPSRLNTNLVYNIPIVIHILHYGETEGVGSNISIAQIQSQIDVINQDFRKKENSNGYNEHEAGVDSRINFIPAVFSPQGNPLHQQGVNRVDLNTLGYSTSAKATFNTLISEVKKATIWDPNRYLNIWVADFSAGYYGLAIPPVNSTLEGMDDGAFTDLDETDGVILHYKNFGSNENNSFDLNPDVDFGRTLTHELGHFFGLRHIWGDGPCGDDDFVDDTPESASSNSFCADRYTCDSKDMIENYMDYTPDRCMNIFTYGQRERMLTVLEVSPRRKELLLSNVIYSSSPVSDFAASSYSILEGETIRFKDLSSEHPNLWHWTFEGANILSSSEPNPSVIYNTSGRYKVTLQTTNPLGVSQVSEKIIEVTVPTSIPTAEFSSDKTNITRGDYIQFYDNSSLSPTSWQWTFEGGTPTHSNLENPIVQYTQGGEFNVELTSTNSVGNSVSLNKSHYVNVEIGPQIQLLKDSISFLVDSNNPSSLTQSLNIENIGSSDLSFNIELLGRESLNRKFQNETTNTLTEYSYDKEQANVYFDGYDEGGDYYAANKFVINEDNFRLTNIKNFYRAGDVDDFKVQYDIYIGDNINTGTRLSSQYFISKNNKGLNGDWVEVTLENSLDFKKDDIVWVVCKYPKNTIAKPAGYVNGLSNKSPVSYWYDGSDWYPDDNNRAYKIRIESKQDFEPFIIFNKSLQIVRSNENIDFPISFNIENIPDGKYEYFLKITSNDPIDPILKIPFTLKTTGKTPLVVIDRNRINFGVLKESESFTSFKLQIQNNGLGESNQFFTLEENSPFSLSHTSFDLLSESTGILDVSLNSGRLGLVQDTLIIESNDRLNPRIEIPLEAYVDAVPTFNSADNLVYEITEEGALNISLEAADVEGEVVYSFDSNLENLTYDFSDSQFNLNFRPSLEQSGAYDFSLIATDTAQQSSTLAFQIIVKDKKLAELVLSDASLDYGTLTESYSTNTKTFNIQNTGKLEANIRFTLEENSPFSLSHTSFELLSKSTGKLNVSLNSGHLGLVQDTLIIESNDRLNPRIEIPLEAYVDAVPTFNYADNLVYEITEEGALNISLEAADVEGEVVYSFDSDLENLTYDSSDSKFNLNFRPSLEQSGTYDFNLIATDTAQQSSTLAFQIIVKDKKLAELVLSDASLDYGTLTESYSTNTKVLSIQNTGKLEANIRFTLEENSPFSLSHTSFELLSKSTGKFNVSLNSGHLGLVQDTLIIESNDRLNPRIEIPLEAYVDAVPTFNYADNLVYEITEEGALNISLEATDVEDEVVYSFDSNLENLTYDFSDSQLNLTFRPSLEQSGTYDFSLIATDTAQQSSTLAFQIIVKDKKLEVLSNNQFEKPSMYPNPFRNHLNIETKLFGLDGMIRVYSLSGHMLLEESFENKETFKLNTKGFRVGIYLIHIILEDRTFVNKVVKDK